MSIVREKKVAPAREYEETVAVICELCGKRGKGESFPGGGDYAEGGYDVNRVLVCHEDGNHYPEGGSTEVVSLDICPDCFATKLVPWFEAQGGKVRKKEVEF